MQELLQPLQQAQNQHYNSRPSNKENLQDLGFVYESPTLAMVKSRILRLLECQVLNWLEFKPGSSIHLHPPPSPLLSRGDTGIDIVKIDLLSISNTEGKKAALHPAMEPQYSIANKSTQNKDHWGCLYESTEPSLSQATWSTVDQESFINRPFVNKLAPCCRGVLGMSAFLK